MQASGACTETMSRGVRCSTSARNAQVSGSEPGVRSRTQHDVARLLERPAVGHGLATPVGCREISVEIDAPRVAAGAACESVRVEPEHDVAAERTLGKRTEAP